MTVPLLLLIVGAGLLYVAISGRPFGEVVRSALTPRGGEKG